MFILKSPNQDAETLVYLLYGCQDGQLKMSMKVKVLPKNFKSERGTGKYAFINQVLNRVAAHIDNLENDKRVTGNPILKEQLRQDIWHLLGGKSPEQKISKAGSAKNHLLLPYLEILIDRRKQGHELTKGNKRFSQNTIKNYVRTKNHLRQFAEYLGRQITFEMVDAGFRANFINWLHDEHSHSLNAVGHSIKNLKMVMAAAYADKMHTNTAFMEKSFFIPGEDATDIYLSEPELRKLQAIDLQNGHDWARDWFLIECYTGLRISDAKRLTHATIADGMISLATEKTDEKVVVPLHPVVKGILEKWGDFPPKLSDQKINKYIKAVAKKAGVDAKVLHTITRAGERIDTYMEKWQMIGNHTGRRTFISTLIKQKVPDQLIMKLTGIKKAETLRKYNKLTPEDAALVAMDLPFFKG